MRNDAMSGELIELERRLGARTGNEKFPALRDGVMRAIEEELNRPSRGGRAGWSWGAIAVALLLVLNFSALWGTGDRYSVWNAKPAGWALADREWLVGQGPPYMFDPFVAANPHPNPPPE
jgi:hypothetical protein